MSTPYRVRLRTIAARQLWDGRKARGGRGFIPGIRHFQAGVRTLHRASGAGDVDAAACLVEIDAALEAVERSLFRWRRGLAGFVEESLEPGTVAGNCAGWRRASRVFRIRAWETRRLALLIEAYDGACVATVEVTLAARKARVFNAHHESIAERARLIRAVIGHGHTGVRFRSVKWGPGAAAGRATVGHAGSCDVTARNGGTSRLR